MDTDSPIAALADPHTEAAPEPEAPPAAAPGGLPAHQVALFDPATPHAPRVELAANFDPHRHVRWEHRPAVAELDLGAIKVTGAEEALLSDTQVKALSARGLTTVKAILRAGREGLKATQGIGATTADELHGWTMRRAAAKWALAELEAEPKPEPAAAEAAPAPIVNAGSRGNRNPFQPPKPEGEAVPEDHEDKGPA